MNDQEKIPRDAGKEKQKEISPVEKMLDMDRREKKAAKDPELALAATLLALSVLLTVFLPITLVNALSKKGEPFPGSTETTTGGGEPYFPPLTSYIYAPAAFTLRPDFTGAADVSENLSSRYGILIEAESGRVLASKDANTRFSPASMTKLMTLIVACEHLTEADLSKNVAMTAEVYEYVRPSKASGSGYYGSSLYGFDPDDETSVLNLLYGIGVQSLADCSMMLVRYLAESEEEFVGWMNDEVAAMGLENTHFDNVIGYDSPENYSTVSDMAMILARALGCDLIKKILSTPSYDFTYSGYNSSGEWVTVPESKAHFYSSLFNANAESSSRFKAYGIGVNGKLPLTNATFGGGKTGSLEEPAWTFSLASFATAKSGGKLLIAVTGEVSGSADVIKDAKLLYDTYA